MDILPALLLGFFGSLHCVGMCGAIALSLGKSTTSWRFISGRMLYNIGRVVTYGILGVLFGTVGSVARISGMQQWLSLGAGIGIIVYLLIPKRISSRVSSLPTMNRFISSLKSQLSPLFTSSRLFAQFSIGVLNGFLPCGFVYMGLAGSLQQPSVNTSVLYMMFFGLGTIPAMLLLSFSSRFFALQKKINIRRLIPFGAATMALLFILRGLALGIPFVSPILPTKVEVLSNVKQDGHCVNPK